MALIHYLQSWVDAQQVSKTAIRNGFRDFVINGFANAAELRTVDTQGARFVDVAGVAFGLDAADTSTADDGVTCVVSSNSQRYKRLVTPLAAAAGREVLTAARTYYVSTTGADTNTGLSVASPFLTIQKAINTVAALDLSIYSVVIQMADGTYTAGANVSAPWTGAGTVTLQGNNATPANVVLNTATCIQASNGGKLHISGMQLGTTANGGSVSLALYALSGGQIQCTTGALRFGASSSRHMSAVDRGKIGIFNGYTLVNTAAIHLECAANAYVQVVGGTVVHAYGSSPSPLTGTYFAYVSRAALCEYYNVTFSGAAPSYAYRYVLDANSVLYTAGAGSSYLPGSTTSVTTGAQYL